jgi:hypothetical protein
VRLIPGLARHLFCVALLALLLCVSTGSVSAQETTIYFHDNSELSFSYPPFQFAGFQISGIQAGPSSSSARAFQSATPDAPLGSGMAVSMSATISVSSQPQVYAAFVAWLSDPFPVNVTLDGNVVMHVWMSSSDSLLLWQGSEFFMGVADYSPTGSTQFQVLDYYSSNPAIGDNVFSSSPKEYVTSTLHISQHHFQSGSKLLFFAGAGSNKQGYTFTVYFDSPVWESRADIPADPSLTLTEIPTLTPILFATLLLLVIATKRKYPRR